MKSMKGLSMNKVLGSIKKKTSGSSGSGSNAQPPAAIAGAASGQSPEKIAHECVRAFCEAGGGVKGDEVLYLPPIVEAAESSPSAAEECARMLRKFLSKDYSSRPSWQYNAIMLMRILTDNPGRTFTRHIDQKFTDTLKYLLNFSKDPSVRHILMETLDEFEHFKVASDDNLTHAVSMWMSEKEKAFRQYGPPQNYRPPRGANLNQNYNPHQNMQFPQQPQQRQQNYFSRAHSNHTLPSPEELSGRLEEAQTSAKLLEQVIMNTPPAEILNNDLIKEFADRCLSASRSIQGYMVSQNPAPDNDTMETLIDTNEQLQTALNQHQRAVLSARKQFAPGDKSPSNESAQGEGSDVSLSRHNSDGFDQGLLRSSTMDSRKPVGNGKGKSAEPYSSPVSPPPGLAFPPLASGSGSGSGSGAVTGSGAGSRSDRHDEEPAQNPFEDPFKDPPPGPHRDGGASSAYSHDGQFPNEPYHPGFAGGASSEMRGGNGGGLTIPGGSGSGSRNRGGDVSDDDDLYSSTPTSKEPVYRY